MRHLDDRFLYSASDLAAFAECEHRTWLDAEAALGGEGPPLYDDPTLEALIELGYAHERGYLERLQASGRGVAVIDTDTGGGPPARTMLEGWRAETLAHMRAGVDVIHQAAVYDGTWHGYADFLIRVETPSDLGAWSYEVVDAKLARSAKPRALIQVCLYSDLLQEMQGLRPRRLHLYLGRKVQPMESFEFAHFAALYRDLRRRFDRHVAARPTALAAGPDPVPFCSICAWRGRCDEERREVDHLSGVAGLARRHLDPLRTSGTKTMAALAERALDQVPEALGNTTYRKVREQARVQVEGRTAGEPRYELLPPEEGRGLQNLPEPDPADWFFDFEGAPYALEDGLEYLWGTWSADGFDGRWAFSRAQERAALEDFLTRAVARLEEAEGFHVYHFGQYEPSALKRLVAIHGVGTAELDHLLKHRVFVDLHQITVQSVRASVSSYSIKSLEEVVGFERDVPLKEAGRKRAELEAALTFGAFEKITDAHRDAVRGYNEDDCRSTQVLRDWLEARRDEWARRGGEPLGRRPLGAETESDAGTTDAQALALALLGGLSEDEAEWSDEDRAVALAAHVLEWHRREAKSEWWEYFRLRDDLTLAELMDETTPLAGLLYQGIVDDPETAAPGSRSDMHRFSFPPQEFKLTEGRSAVDRDSGTSLTVHRVDASACILDIKRGRNKNDTWDPHGLQVLLPGRPVRTFDQQDRLLEIGEALRAAGLVGLGTANPVAHALLTAGRPRFGADPSPLMDPSLIDPLDRARRCALELRDSVLPVQGPPGTGKTYSGARMIVALLEAGVRVGVTAPSHKVVTNLLNDVCEAAGEAGFALRGLQAGTDSDGCPDARIEQVDKNAKAPPRLAASDAPLLVAGTAWLWARDDMKGSVDVLFVDEAGQFSLANALAVSWAAGRMVLLGDPQQLAQPQKGIHPAGAEASALGHMIGPGGVIERDRGLFLDTTWRMHPAITAFTSELFYQGELGAHPANEGQRVVVAGRAVAPGLYLVPVDHAGNTRASGEEAAAAVDLCRRFLDRGRWVDRDGAEHPMARDCLRVVAPYNAQVGEIHRALEAAGLGDVPVGTVDKFQGQQAPVAIYSMASSSAEDAPRGMSFLYALDRLNVATSRARVATYLVASPEVFGAACSTPAQMRELNAFLRYREMAIRPMSD